MVNEASSGIDPEISIESNADDNQLNSTPPAGISGEKESVENVKTPCEQMQPFVDAEKSIGSNENSDAQEQNSATSFEEVNSLGVSLFEPREREIKPANQVFNENHRQTQCQTQSQPIIEREEKKKSSGTGRNRTVGVCI